MEAFLIIFFLILVGLLIYSITDLDNKREGAKSFASKIDANPGFYGSIKLIKRPYPRDVIYFIAVGDKDCLLIGNDFKMTKVEPSELLDVELVVNSKVVTAISRGSQLVGAAAGFAVAGGVGAIIGGVTAKTHAREKVSDVSLRLLLDNIAEPAFEIGFKEATVTGPTAPEAMMAEAKLWLDRLRVIVSRGKEKRR